jgi:hypothetical protein
MDHAAGEARWLARALAALASRSPPPARPPTTSARSSSRPRNARASTSCGAASPRRAGERDVRQRERALTGFVQRSDGRTTVWIDGNPVPLNSPRNAKLDPKAVQAYSPGDDVKVERKPAR